MTFSLGWDRRDQESGRRVNVEFALVRENATWKIRRERGEDRETFKPEQADWDELFEVIERHLKRGKVTHTDEKIVKTLYKRWRGDY